MNVLQRTQALFFTLAMLSLVMGVVQKVRGEPAPAPLVIGEHYHGPTLYCTSKDHAEQFAKALTEKDEKTVHDKQAPGVCHFHPSQFSPRKLVSTHGTEDPVYVVEVESGGGTFYLVTMVKVSNRPLVRGTSA